MFANDLKFIEIILNTASNISSVFFYYIYFWHIVWKMVKGQLVTKKHFYLIRMRTLELNYLQDNVSNFAHNLESRDHVT